MDEKILKRLLKEAEGTHLDFKTTFYDISDKKSKTDFVKDILSFANSTLDQPAYIICGVKENYSGEKEIIGIDSHQRIDDANWVQLLRSYTSHPINIKMEKVKLEIFNRYVAVIEISKEQHRPILCTKDEGEKLKQGVIYFRHGSTNDVAKDLVTLEKIISSSTKNRPGSTIANDPTYNKYSKFPPAPYYKFLGRDNEINTIFEELVYHHKNYLLSLTGDGGIGKTSIAYKVAEQIKDGISKGENDFDDVVWISAKDQRIYFDERRELHREFHSLDDLYNKILLLFYDIKFIKNMDMQKKEEHVNLALEGTKFFIVLDNLEVFTNEELLEIHRFIKNTPIGHKFLLTSRHDLRVQEFIPIHKFEKTISELYITDLINDLSDKNNETYHSEIKQHFHKFYELTNGNPLYIKFFIAQVIRGRSLDDILKRRNIEGEKPLKTYCFDSTLNNLNKNELTLMYSLAVSDQNNLCFHELKYLTLIPHNLLQEILESLNSHSLVNKEFLKGQQVYSLNALLRTYLLEEKRIPGSEYSRLFQKSRKISHYDKEINISDAYNFGLQTILNQNEIMSYNMIIDLLKGNEVYNEHYLEEIMVLYPGNYLVPFYKNFKKIKDGKTSSYNIYTDINSDFAHVLTINNYDEQRVMSYVWKSFLYLMLGKYDDVIADINYVISNIQTEHISLLKSIEATVLNMKALDEYSHRRYTLHDSLRETADEIFTDNIQKFITKPYFLFIKRNLAFAYNKNNQHIKKQVAKLDDFSPFTPDPELLKNQSIFNNNRLPVS
jgi:Putative DNA-binding domain/NB-ARC domain